MRWCFFFCFFHWLASSCSFGLLLLRALFSDWRSLNRLFWLDGLPLWLATYSTSLAWRASSRWTATQEPTSSSASSALLGTDSPLVLSWCWDSCSSASKRLPSHFLLRFNGLASVVAPGIDWFGIWFLLGFHLLFRGEASSSASSCFYRDHTSCSRPRCRGSLLPPSFPLSLFCGSSGIFAHIGVWLLCSRWLPWLRLHSACSLLPLRVRLPADYAGLLLLAYFRCGALLLHGLRTPPPPSLHF